MTAVVEQACCCPDTVTHGCAQLKQRCCSAAASPGSRYSVNDCEELKTFTETKRTRLHKNQTKEKKLSQKSRSNYTEKRPKREFLKKKTGSSLSSKAKRFR